MSTASGKGYSFITEWRDCPRKFYLHKIAGLVPTAIKQAPSMGSVLHALQESYWYGSFDDLANDYASDVAEKLSHYKAAWFEDEEFDAAVLRVAAAFKAWRNTFGHQDQQEYELEGAEVYLEEKLPNGYTVSGRIDRLVRRKDSGALVFFDTKTTSWSPEAMHKKVEDSDQMTMYTWLLHKKYGDRPVSMIPDIVYLKPRVPTCHRFGEIRRSKQDIESFIWGMCHDWESLACDVCQYWENKAPAEYLFPRHPSGCSEYGCEYSSICRARLDETTPPPIDGFTVEPTLDFSTFIRQAYRIDPIESSMEDNA